MKKTSVVDFSARFLGFGFYWAWLFSVMVNSSTVFGGIYLSPGIPFECGFQLLRALCCLGFATGLSVVKFRAVNEKVFGMACAVLGVLGTAALSFLDSTAFSIGKIAILIFTSVVDAYLFISWMRHLCRFGSRNTIVCLGVSYASGALISAIISTMISPYNSVLASLLPLLCLFVLLYSEKGGDGLPDCDLGKDRDENPFEITVFWRLFVALLAYGFIFGMYKAIPAAQFLEHATVNAFSQVPACILVFLVILALYSLSEKPGVEFEILHYLPTIFTIGLGIAFIVEPKHFFVSTFMVSFAYNIFEIVAFGAMVDIAKRRNLGMLASFGFGRFANTGGIAMGMLSGYAFASFLPQSESMSISLVVCMVAVVVVSTAFFGRKELGDIMRIAEEITEAEDDSTDVAQLELAGEMMGRALTALAEEKSLTDREQEVFFYLVKGRNATVIATQLYLSVGTVKSHMANIYRKFGIRSHQELLDIVDSVQAEFSKNTKDN